MALILKPECCRIQSGKPHLLSFPPPHLPRTQHFPHLLFSQPFAPAHYHIYISSLSDQDLASGKHLTGITCICSSPESAIVSQSLPAQLNHSCTISCHLFFSFQRPVVDLQNLLFYIVPLQNCQIKSPPRQSCLFLCLT